MLLAKGVSYNRKKKNPSYFIWHQLPSFFFEEKQFSPSLEAKRKLYSSIEFKEIFNKTFWVNFTDGASTLGITTFSITTLSIMGLIATLSIMTRRNGVILDSQHEGT
jgi:hypothetical protein